MQLLWCGMPTFMARVGPPGRKQGGCPMLSWPELPTLSAPLGIHCVGTALEQHLPHQVLWTSIILHQCCAGSCRAEHYLFPAALLWRCQGASYACCCSLPAVTDRVLGAAEAPGSSWCRPPITPCSCFFR